MASILRATTGTICAKEVMQILVLNRKHASTLLAGWHNQGALRRVAHGLYVPVKPAALGQSQVLEDPWVLVPKLFSPAYVGGWSALEYWDLTEQLFRSVCVLTNKRVTPNENTHQGVKFLIQHQPQRQMFGTKTIWRDSVKIQVSDPAKTMLDVIGNLYLGAGLQHSVDCLAEFKKIFHDKAEFDKLLEYSIKIKNGALFKKLGYLAEQLDFKKSFVKECKKRLTSGYTHLDKSSTSNKLITSWKLWVPKGSIR